jgi:hypothetical protein
MIHSKTFTQFIEQASAPAPKPDLNALRQASASATMAGPSKEAQALMSDRTKNILSGQSVYGGSNKLKAGTDAQVGVEKMKTAMSTPPPAATQQTHHHRQHNKHHHHRQHNKHHHHRRQHNKHHHHRQHNKHHHH